MKIITSALVLIYLTASTIVLAAASDKGFFQYLENNSNWSRGTKVAVAGEQFKLLKDGDGQVIVNAASPDNLLTNVYLGDSVLSLTYMADANTNASVYLQGRYAVKLTNNSSAGQLSHESAGAVGQRWNNDTKQSVDGALPLESVSVAPATWHTLTAKFRAPRYDDASNKIENALLLEVAIDDQIVQRNTVLPGFSIDPIKPWETTSGRTMVRVKDGRLALGSLSTQPADFDKLTVPVSSGEATNEASLVDFVSLGKKSFQALGCKECHAVVPNDSSMKTGPNLFGLFKKTPRNREIVETGENHRFTIKADESYFYRSIRTPAAELAIHEGGAKQGEAFMPIMPPYHQQTLPDKQLDALYFYLKTLNDAREQGAAIKLVDAGGPIKYDPLIDDLQFLVDDTVRIQRGPMEGMSARAIHVGQPNAINYSFDPRVLGIVKLWQGGFLDMSGELRNRGGDGLKTGFETRAINLGDSSVLFAPLNQHGGLIDFSFKEAIWNDNKTVDASLWSETDHLTHVAAVDAQFLGYQRPSTDATAAPRFRYRVGDNTLSVTTELATNGDTKITVAGTLRQAQSFRINSEVLTATSVSVGQVDAGVWTVPKGVLSAELKAKVLVADKAWKPKPSSFSYRKQALRIVAAVANLPAGYSIENYLPPQDNYGRDQLFEALGLAVAKDGTVVVATRTAGVWRIKDGQWQLFAEGLFDSLGVQIEDDHGLQLIVGQKAELTRITDTDGDGLGDSFETLFDAHSYHGNYHTYLHGPTRGADGAYYINLNLAHADEAVYKAGGDYMGTQGGLSGWSVRVQPDGEFDLFANGLRSPAGLATGPEGKLWYTDNQGEFVGTSKLFLLQGGKFYGHPSSLVDLPKMKPDSPEIQWPQVADTREQAVVLLPHNSVANSPGHPLWDSTQGKFGAFAGQMLIGDQTQSNLLRITTEQVGESRQGAVMPFMSGLASGVMRGVFLPDNSLLVGQAGRGWQAKGGHVAALQRIRWDGKTVPVAITTVEATANGFTIRFTQPLTASDVDALSQALAVKSWVYRDAPDYGSPELDMRDEQVAVSPAEDGLALVVVLANTKQNVVHPQQTARVYHLQLNPVGLFASPPAELLQAYYTLYEFADH
ncbi:family 16 glycoside hydrolase [Gilvimarinus polysaccharolyticus]|uniref:family 16 glycoside hydrolase n=1 Tax=Gilvimarinus polysaccharolyticus TaxID=863921 RepID=UPI0006731D1C|nr:family 16 glycoside hydrolase [Gilvimarinus polysaccharolyticus]